MLGSINQIKKEIIESQEQLKNANEKLRQLRIEKNKIIPNNLSIENNELKLTHKLCLEDMEKFRKDIETLIAQLSLGENKITKLKEENQALKIKINSKKKDEKLNKNNNDLHIINTNQLSQFLGYKSKKTGKISEKKGEQKNKKFDTNAKIKLKTEIEKKFQELKEKSNRFNETIEEQDKILKDYKNYLNEVNQNINNYNEGLYISVLNSVPIQDNEHQKNLDEIYSLIDKISLSLVNVDDLITKIKDTFGKNIENILVNINTELNDLNKEENKNNETYDIILANINIEMEEIQNIFEKFWKDNEDFYEKSHDIGENMDKLKYLCRKYGEEYKKKREKAKNLSKQEDNNINLEKDIFDEFEEKEANLGESFTFAVKEQKKKEDLYTTVNIFKHSESDLLEQYIDEAQMLRKNYHVICYVYDDYDIYDVYYDLKAVGLRRGEYFPKCSHGFSYDKEIEIQSFLINGEEYPYIHKRNNIEFEINLKNSETKKIHILYKSSKNKMFYTQNELEERNIYRYESYGLNKSLAGQKAKFSLILKGNFDIVNFDEYFFIRNNKNTKEVEYIWGGRVPYEGRKTQVMLSKKEALWSFNFSLKIQANQRIKDTMLYVPIEFIGGNNEIMNIKPACEQSTNIVLEEELRLYSVEFYNTNSNIGEFSISGVLKNKCKGEWEVGLTDEEIENKIPQEDKICKEQLKSIAKKIISEFDQKNKNSDFVYHDYMKIGMWVKENIKYDYNFVGKNEYTSIDVYNLRKGVCHHFTKLSNALLYALGYKVIYCSGYVCKGNNSFKTSSGHAWSLIRLENNKWYPFDSTWGIFSGKLPVGHIFASFFSKQFKCSGYDGANIAKHETEGSYIG